MRVHSGLAFGSRTNTAPSTVQGQAPAIAWQQVALIFHSGAVRSAAKAESTSVTAVKGTPAPGEVLLDGRNVPVDSANTPLFDVPLAQSSPALFPEYRASATAGWSASISKPPTPAEKAFVDSTPR